MDDFKALIVGGGIAGAAAATALRKEGLSVHVYERSSAPYEVDAGVSVWGNAIAALSKLNLARKAIERGDIIHTATLVNWHGKTISTHDVAAADKELGFPSIVIHRRELLDVLLSDLDEGIVRYDAPVEAVHHDHLSARLHTARGRFDSGTVLIGADGERSTVRTIALGKEEPRYSGYTCWRAVLPFPESEWRSGQAVEVWGRGQRFGITRIGGGRVYWWATRNTDAGGQDADAKRELMHFFHGWFDTVTTLIRQTPDEAISRTDVYDRIPTRRWGVGRVTLAGDAAHAPTPNLGQGACMAIEDSIVLARYLADAARDRREPAEALRAYEHERFARTAMVTRQSWRLGQIGQWANPLVCAVRDLAAKLAPESIYRSGHRGIVGYQV